MPLLIALAACTPDLTPAWAFDPIWIEPMTGDAVHGFQTWEIYGPKWPSSYSDRHYVCSVVVEIEGAPIPCDAEEGCTWAWDITAALVESDCADAELAEDGLFVSLDRLALGGPSTSEDAPWPQHTSVGWADYGNGWEVHGSAYPEALDLGAQVESGEWDGVQPFLLVPESAFSLAP
jgi:hypothetical protein